MSGYVPKPARPNANRKNLNSGAEPIDLHALHWAQYPDLPQHTQTRPTPVGCVFAKSCNLPDSIINHSHPTGFVPVETLADYGMWAVLGTGAAISAQGTPLQWVAGSTTGRTVASRLAGSLALTLLESAGVLAASATVGTVALLMPNTLAPDSAFYTQDQYTTLDVGRTRVRVNVKTLPDGSVNAYGFYTGGKTDWESVPVIQAEKNGEQYVADIGNGIGLTWTPAADTEDVLGIPALEGAPPLRTVWVYPPTPQTQAALHNPEHPPEFQDAIIWFPADAGIAPIYVVLSTQLEKNKIQGKDFEDESYDVYSAERNRHGREVTVKTEKGIRVRLNMLGEDADGTISCIECKSSDTAPLTPNQKLAFPEIEESGATVVGKGKPGFPGGTVIPPTKIKIVRPNP